MRVNKIKNSYPNLQALVGELFNILNNEPTHDLTLATGTVSTSVSNALVGKDSVIAFMPKTADAATEGMYVSTLGKGTFTVTHSSGASVRSYKYMVHG